MKKMVCGAKGIFKIGIVVVLLCMVCMISVGEANAQDLDTNGTMMQYFEWDATSDGSFWNALKSDAKHLGEMGITSVWLPPAYKGSSGTYDVGYGAYDLYDLGEFNQKGTVRTKYGTKDQYLAAINELHKNGVDVYADVVLNHKAGADSAQTVTANNMAWDNRNYILKSNVKVGAWTVFNFPGRNNKYSSFKWNYTHFDGVDYDNLTGKSGLFRFTGKSWDSPVSTENGNYDYLMYADIDMGNSAVVNELITWGKWYVNFANLDGFRLDAVKHIDFDFFADWLTQIRKATGKELFTVGEYYSSSVSELNNYISATNGTMSLFDFPLHYRFVDVSNAGGSYDMRYLFRDTLVSSNPVKAVTFVDNHDTQPGQSTSTVGPGFKLQAYVAILTRNVGYPCVFYGDYYGTGNGSIPSYKIMIDRIMQARKDYAYGTMHDYLNNKDVIGWSMEGDSSHPNSGLASVITDGEAGSIEMFVGKKHAGETWYDITGNYSGTVTISSTGYGKFHVKEKSASVWVKMTEEMPTNNKVTIYYKYPATYVNGTYIHYQLGSKAWTATPGKLMTKDVVFGYDSITINMGSNTLIRCCFNNGKGVWDNNKEADYVLAPGTYYIDGGKVCEGKPVNKTTIVGGVTGLTSTARANNSITLKWNKVANANRYVVYKLNNSTKAVEKYYITSATKYTVTGLSTASKYTFVVKAERDYRGKKYKGSSPIYVSYTAPNMVKGLTQSTQTNTSVTLKWNTAAKANGYRVYRYDASKKGYVKVADTTATTYKVTGLSAGGTYKLAVKSYYKTSSGVIYFNPTFTVITTITKPATPSFSLTSPGKKQVKLAWTKKDWSTGYYVYYKIGSTGAWKRITTTTGLNYINKNLTSGKRYYFTVKAYKTGGGKTVVSDGLVKSVVVK
ncbi:MAG: alpha-amylase [Lachnospiraceae bacterium]|nr:alpha-amylase [Lachnospiraceae bacterium]